MKVKDNIPNPNKANGKSIATFNVLTHGKQNIKAE
jgi:hypothetical protein